MAPFRAKSQCSDDLRLLDAVVRARSWPLLPVIAALALQLHAEGKDPWIFSAITNISSLRGVEKAGLERRFSLRCSGSLFFKTGVHQRSSAGSPPVARAASAA